MATVTTEAVRFFSRNNIMVTTALAVAPLVSLGSLSPTATAIIKEFYIKSIIDPNGTLDTVTITNIKVSRAILPATALGIYSGDYKVTIGGVSVANGYSQQ